MRTFCLAHGLVRCNMSAGVHARARSGRVIQRCHNKNTWESMWPGMWVTSRTGSVGWDFWEKLSWVPGSKEDGWLSLARQGIVAGAARVGMGRARWKSQQRKYVPLSLCRKIFKLKGNKKFRTWTKKSSSVFRVSGFLCSIYIYVIYIYVRFTYPYHGYGT